MYVGDTYDGSGLHHLVWEVVGNVIDLHLAGKACSLSVHIGDGQVEVLDDGPGFPVGRHPRLEEDVLDIIFTRLHAGATFDGHFPHVHIGPQLHGVGLAAVNALSEELEVETRRRGRVYRQRYRRGQPQGAVTEVGRTTTTGTRIRFRPDPSIFHSVAFDVNRLHGRLHELAYFNPSLTVRFAHAEGRACFRERDGLMAMVWQRVAQRGGEPDHRIWRASRLHDGAQVDIALTWLGRGPSDLRSFVGQAPTPDGGTHVAGFWRGLSLGLSALGAPAVGERVLPELLSPGLIAVVHVGLDHDPTYGSPTKDRLCSPRAQAAVEAVLAEGLTHWCRRHPPLLEALRQRSSGPSRPPR